MMIIFIVELVSEIQWFVKTEMIYTAKRIKFRSSYWVNVCLEGEVVLNSWLWWWRHYDLPKALWSVTAKCSLTSQNMWIFRNTAVYSQSACQVIVRKPWIWFRVCRCLDVNRHRLRWWQHYISKAIHAHCVLVSHYNLQMICQHNICSSCVFRLFKVTTIRLYIKESKVAFLLFLMYCLMVGACSSKNM
jgi:hypothetical protein